MNEAACRAKEAVGEEEEGAAINMTALPDKATSGVEALVFCLRINRIKTRAETGWRDYLPTTDDEHRFTCFGFVGCPAKIHSCYKQKS